MAADRGYIWDDPRNAWTKSTLSHNIVTVDAQNQSGNPKPAHLELFGTGAGVEIVQASAAPYDQCDLYQRTCVLIQIPGEQTYAIDFFRINGGNLHQYGFHCNGRLTGIRGADPQPVDEQIEWLDNIRADHPQNPFTATWQNQDLRMDFTLLNPIHRLLLTDAPGWRSDLGDQLNAPPVQQILAERKDDMNTRYAAVIAPYTDKSPIQSAHLILDDPDTRAIAIAVKRDGCTDYILSAPEGATHDLGPVSITGQFAFASIDNQGILQRAYLLCGTELRYGSHTLTLSQAQTPLDVTSVDNRTYHISQTLSEPDTLPGTYLLCADTGYEIESASEKSITVRDYPTTACDRIVLLNATTFDP